MPKKKEAVEPLPQNKVEVEVTVTKDAPSTRYTAYGDGCGIDVSRQTGHRHPYGGHTLRIQPEDIPTIVDLLHEWQAEFDRATAAVKVVRG